MRRANVRRGVGRAVFGVALGLAVLAAMAIEAVVGSPVWADGFEEDKPAWIPRLAGSGKVEFLREGGHAGNGSARLRAERGQGAALTRKTPALAPGVYELTLWAQGTGTLRIEVLPAGRRKMRVAADTWSQYGYLFEVNQPSDIEAVIDVRGDARVDDVELRPADPEQRRAWDRQKEALIQFGYVPGGYDAQRPEPRSSTADSEAAVPPLTGMVHKVVFYDPRYDSWWNIHCDQFARWFQARGFEVKGAPQLVAWMEARIRDGAYGSVVVMSMGLVPQSLITPADDTCLLYRYLEQGGRMVWTGNTALWMSQDETGPARVAGIEAGVLQAILGVGEQSTSWGGDQQLTPAGKQWGLKGPGSGARAVWSREITLALSEDPKQGKASIWLLNVNPKYPLSGFLAHVFAVDGRRTDLLEHFFTLALYTGHPVVVPPATEPPATVAPAGLKAKLVTQSAKNPRRAYVRGETVDVSLVLAAATNTSGRISGTLRLVEKAPGLKTHDLAGIGIPESQRELADFEKTPSSVACVWRQDFAADLKPGNETVAGTYLLQTADLAIGNYQFQTEILDATSNCVAKVRQPLVICPRPRTDGIHCGVVAVEPKNPYRLHALMENLSACRLSPSVDAEDRAAEFADACLANNLTFSVKITSQVPLSEKRWGAHGEEFQHPWGPVGIAGERTREKAREYCRKLVEPLVRWPAFSKHIVVNDDLNALAGWDYHPENVREFKVKTGREAPVPKELEEGKPPYQISIQRAAGIVPDDEPWLQWNDFLCRDVFGGYNDAQRRGIQTACPEALVGAQAGGAQWPFYNVPCGLYPPANCGRSFGLNCSSAYLYLSYWSPSVNYLYWTELARMENRDIPVWLTPNAFPRNGAHYGRNVFHLLMASGVRALMYYQYYLFEPDGLVEMRELGKLVEQYGPVLRRLKPSPHRTGLVVPFTEACYNIQHPLYTQSAYAHLLRAHADVEPISEREAETGAYPVIALSSIQHLRASTVNALEQLVRQGGTVLMDSGCAVPVRGGTKLDLHFGAAPTDYGDGQRVAAIRRTVPPKGFSPFDSPETTTVFRPMGSADGVQYLYVVHVDSAEEYALYRENFYVGRYANRPPEKKRMVDEFVKSHGMGEHSRPVTMTVAFDPKVLPAQGAVVDFYGRRVLKPVAGADGRMAVKVTTPSFGGALLAFLPSLPSTVAIDRRVIRATAGAGKSFRKSWEQWWGRVLAGDEIQWEITLTDQEKRRMQGVIPLQVVLRDPAGQEEREVTGYYAVEGGMLKLAFPPARNHPPGKWRLECTEMATGKKCVANFVVAGHRE